MQNEAIADSFRQIVNFIPTITLCGLVWTAAKVITKVNNLYTEVRLLRKKVHRMSNVISALATATGKPIPKMNIEEDDEERARQDSLEI